jgi:hypothetical protein
VTGFADAVRFGDLGEREGPIDRQSELSGLDELAHRGERVEGVAVGEAVC